MSETPRSAIPPTRISLRPDAVHQHADQGLADGEHDHGEHDRAGELRPVPAELLRHRLEHDAEEEPRSRGDGQGDGDDRDDDPGIRGDTILERRLDLCSGPESICRAGWSGPITNAASPRIEQRGEQSPLLRHHTRVRSSSADC